jgi:hypothetical protein
MLAIFYCQCTGPGCLQVYSMPDDGTPGAPKRDAADEYSTDVPRGSLAAAWPMATEDASFGAATSLQIDTANVESWQGCREGHSVSTSASISWISYHFLAREEIDSSLTTCPICDQPARYVYTSHHITAHPLLQTEHALPDTSSHLLGEHGIRQHAARVDNPMHRRLPLFSGQQRLHVRAAASVALRHSQAAGVGARQRISHNADRGARPPAKGSMH